MSKSEYHVHDWEDMGPACRSYSGEEMSVYVDPSRGCLNVGIALDDGVYIGRFASAEARTFAAMLNEAADWLEQQGGEE